MRPLLAVRLLLACINIPAKVGRAAWASCFRETAERALIFGINECLTSEQRDLYRELAKDLGYDYFGTHSPNPVFWRRDRYELVYARVVQLHGSARGRLARQWPGFNAARSATVAILRDLRTGAEVTVINVHLVPRGRKVAAAWRVWARAVSLAKIAAIVRRQRRAGRVVALMGDFNIWERVRIWGIRWLRATGVDKVGIGIPRGAELTDEDSDLYDADTDHKHGVAAEATVALRRAA